MQVYLVAVSAYNVSEKYPCVKQTVELVQEEDAPSAEKKVLEAVKAEVFKPTDGWERHQTTSVVVEFGKYLNTLCYIHVFMSIVFQILSEGKLKAVAQTLQYEVSDSQNSNSSSYFLESLEKLYPEDYWLLAVKRRCYNIVPDDQVHQLN